MFRVVPSTALLRVGIYAAGAAVAALLIVGIPTDVVPNQWFTRMTPVRPQDYAFLGLTALITGVLGASYAFPNSCPLPQGKVTAGGMLSFLAIGCPICNKLIVVLLGVSGALTYFAPIQPILGGLSVTLLGFAAWYRWRAVARSQHLI